MVQISVHLKLARGCLFSADGEGETGAIHCNCRQKIVGEALQATPEITRSPRKVHDSPRGSQYLIIWSQYLIICGFEESIDESP